MPNEVLIYFLANIFLNSILAFSISVLTVEFFIFILRLNRKKMFKTIYFLRMLPFIKIIYDVIFNFKISSWAVANGIDIINRIPNSMTMHIGAGLIKPFIPIFYYLDFSIYHMYTVSLADMFTQYIGFDYTFFLVLILLTVSLSMVLYYGIRQIYSYITIKIMANSSHPSNRLINNDILLKQLKRKNVEILVSPAKGFSPFSFGIIHPEIIIPSEFYKKLTDDEYEALLTHEIGHIGWWNTITSILLLFMKSFFWFIPFIHFYIKKINLIKELACDVNCMKYYCNTLTVAELLKKAAYYVQKPLFSTASPLFTASSPLLLRVKTLLDLSMFKPGENSKDFLFKTISSIVILIISFLISFFVLNSRFGII